MLNENTFKYAAYSITDTMRHTGCSASECMDAISVKELGLQNATLKEILKFCSRILSMDNAQLLINQGSSLEEKLRDSIKDIEPLCY